MEQKKTTHIGTFNIVDIAAVILILAVLAFAAWRMLRPEAPPAPSLPVTFVARVEGVPNDVYENCLKHLPSPLMASGALVGGQIDSVEAAPYHVLTADGQWVEDPDHITLYFTCSTTTPQEAVMTTKVGEQEVRIGKTDYILKSEYIEFRDVSIVNVIWGESE